MCVGGKRVSAGFKFELADCLLEDCGVEFDLLAIVLLEKFPGCLFGAFGMWVCIRAKAFGNDTRTTPRFPKATHEFTLIRYYILLSTKGSLTNT